MCSADYDGLEHSTQVACMKALVGYFLFTPRFSWVSGAFVNPLTV